VKKALPLMKDGGSIILISPLAVVKGIARYGADSATKATVRSFMWTWTAELNERRIRVNAISPGPINMPIIDSQAPPKEAAAELRANFEAAVPLNRLGNPEESRPLRCFSHRTKEATSLAWTSLSTVA
jgi:NAD(P)-dependent dehydrogenase (short-subunit alcohol dehydrogenase family)